MVFSVLLICFSLNAAPRLEKSGDCTVLVSPKRIVPGQAIRVLVASEKPNTQATLKAVGPSGSLAMLGQQQGGGPPYWWTAEFVAKGEGTYRVWLEHENSCLIEKSFSIDKKTRILKPSSFIWQTEHSWTRQFENLYAAWIERLFLNKEEGRSWDFLHHVLRDSEGNFLHNHLGLNEDGTLILDPDCADNPFFFRAYFAWKLGLPYGHHICDWGNAQRAPRCGQWFSNHALRKERQEDIEAFQSFVRTIKNNIHSGSARTGFSDNNTDLYPLPLQREELRPGSIFADPYGHTLMIVRWIPQRGDKSGQLLAVDAQPDGTIGIRRFWKGQFLFVTNRVIGEPGFKAFRPIGQENGQLRILTNQEIADSQDYGNFSLHQQHMSPQEFYDSMDRLINPRPLDPITVFRELHDAVQERLQARARAVANGEKYMIETNFEVIPMPSGARIFQTSGPWEDYSTPARDMRLLIALDVLTDFPNKVMRNPEAFANPASKKLEDLKIELENLHRIWAEEITITYTRSNSLPHSLTLTNILNRGEKLEMAYNPNDGVEVRWGAAEGSEEFSSCKRRAPVAQRQRMESYRRWFKNRIFPIR
ncbi:MAG: hypothetical protein JSV17_11575 [Candidatus Aminicenantes bacterium]|nr:MAG: hypothetical protein JSV17_11575 [Candidatus Aminicenantes bacterium]